MKKKRKLISILLSIFMVFMLIPVGVFADGAPATSGSCGANGGNVVWSLNTEGVLTISGNGEMEDYWFAFDDLRSPWDGNETIKTIVIEEGVTTVSYTHLEREGRYGACLSGRCGKNLRPPPVRNSVGFRQGFLGVYQPAVFPILKIHPAGKD